MKKRDNLQINSCPWIYQKVEVVEQSTNSKSKEKHSSGRRSKIWAISFLGKMLNPMQAVHENSTKISDKLLQTDFGPAWVYRISWELQSQGEIAHMYTIFSTDLTMYVLIREIRGWVGDLRKPLFWWRYGRGEQLLWKRCKASPRTFSLIFFMG